MPDVVIPDDWPPVLASSPAFQTLRKAAEIEYFDTLPGSEQALIERIARAKVVVNIRSSSRFSAEVFEQCRTLRMLSIWGTGTDNIDLAAAARHGVRIANTPGVSAISVAEHTLALMLATARMLPAQDAAVRSGTWPRGQSIELNGKTLGVIGLGAIGRRFAQLGNGIGMRVIAWTLHPNPALGVRLVELHDLLASSDVISVHVRLSPRTERMIGQREFALMKESAILLNTARGAVVDEYSLVEALTKRKIAGAGLDVFHVEPLPPGHPILKLSNVVVTPHSAGITPEALEAGLQMCVAQALEFLKT